jgi:hypothetical protein
LAHAGAFARRACVLLALLLAVAGAFGCTCNFPDFDSNFGKDAGETGEPCDGGADCAVCDVDAGCKPCAEDSGCATCDPDAGCSRNFTDDLIWSDDFASKDFSAWSRELAAPSAADLSQSTSYVIDLGDGGRGYPLPPSGNHFAARLERNQDGGCSNLYKYWSPERVVDAYGRDAAVLPNADFPSGVYSAWYFFPSNHPFGAQEGHVMGFNELIAPDAVLYPQWWLSFAQGNEIGISTTDPVLYPDFITNTYAGGYRPDAGALPLNRWFEVAAHVHALDHIEWYVDGTLVNVSTASLDAGRPIGRTRGPDAGYCFNVGHTKADGFCLVTDVSVRRLPPGENLIPNPGFENGTLQPWNNWGSNFTLANHDQRSGSFSGYINSAKGGAGGAVRVPVKPNTTYVLSAYGKKNGIQWAAVGYELHDATYALVAKGSYAAPFQSASYEQRSMRLTTTPNTAYVDVLLWSQRGAAHAGPSEHYVDDLVLRRE